MKAIKDILVQPHMTEKTTAMRLGRNQYVFQVSTEANKVEIKKAVEARFQVIVESVNTINQQGKIKSMRGQPGRRAGWKKAVVRLKSGDAIKEIE